MRRIALPGEVETLLDKWAGEAKWTRRERQSMAQMWQRDGVDGVVAVLGWMTRHPNCVHVQKSYPAENVPPWTALQWQGWHRQVQEQIQAQGTLGGEEGENVPRAYWGRRRWTWSKH